MKVKRFRASLPQAAFSAKQVLGNEAKVAQKQNIEMYRLMKCAGKATFQHIYQNYLSRPNLAAKGIIEQQILVVCGKGNNGGDGFIVAGLASQEGFHVTVLLTVSPEELSGDALRAYQNYIKINNTEAALVIFDQQDCRVEYVENFKGSLIVDAIFGIGFKGSLPNHIAILVEAINQHSAKVVSVDIPSGLCATTGYVENTAVVANSTVTFIALKSGLLTGKSINHVGQLYFADLSIGPAFLAQIPSDTSVLGEAIYQYLPTRLPNSHKGNIGLCMAIGGEQGFAGAIRLSAEAALRSGAALVSVCCHQTNQALVFNGRPELMLAPTCAAQLVSHAAFTQAKLYVIGPGLGQNEWGKALFNLMLVQNKPCVIDADGLRLLAQSYYQGILDENIKHNKWVLTPHPGEAAALLGCTVLDIERDRFSAVRNIALQYKCVCVLKGAGSLISDGQQVWVNTSGNSGMASGGMGDVLSGIIAAIIMQKDVTKDICEKQKLIHYAQLTALAVYIHGKAADFIAQKHGKIGMLASDLLPIIQQLINNKV
jgi:NAD(P)H-hydrate epimerase